MHEPQRTRIIQIAKDRFGLGFFVGAVCAGALITIVLVIGYFRGGVPARLMGFQPPRAATEAPRGKANKNAQPKPSLSAGSDMENEEGDDNEDALSLVDVAHVEHVLAPWAVDAPQKAPEDDKALYMPKSLKKRVQFWKRVWADVPDNVHFLVDQRFPWVIHERVTCAKASRVTDRSCSRKISHALNRVKRRLRTLARRPTRRHRRAYGKNKALMKSASASIIRVSGRKGALERALDRAGDALFLAEQIFATEGLPRSLSRIAVVESLYRSGASSRAGAVGAFQFTPVTAREYILVDSKVDERLDPTRSAFAAAQYLKVLKGSMSRWGLAITAYNTGPTRMNRMIKKHGTKDLGKLIAKATDSRFGFDGQNYYAQVLAVIAATSKVESLVVPWAPTVRITKTMTLNELEKKTKVSAASLKKANPALLPAVTVEGKRMPIGYLVNLPTSGPAVSKRRTSAGPRGT